MCHFGGTLLLCSYSCGTFIKRRKKLTPLLAGGGQEGDLRSTTENVAGIAATAKALRLVTDKEAYALPKIAKMKEVIYDELAKHKDIVIFSGKDDTFAPNSFNLWN